MKNNYALWHLDGKLFEFNTDEEILQYLHDNDIKYHILAGATGNFISIDEPRYFVMPGLLYYLQEEQHV